MSNNHSRHATDTLDNSNISQAMGTLDKEWIQETSSKCARQAIDTQDQQDTLDKQQTR